MAKVCVTGASGFIGSHLVKVLLEKGYNVVAAVRDVSEGRTGHLKQLPNAAQLTLSQADVLTAYTLDSVFAGCDAVFHLAAPVKLPDQVADYRKELLTPAVDGTNNVLEACEKAGVKHVILTSSTAAVVGVEKPATHTWIENDWSSEANLTERKAWYPLAKLLAEQAAWSFMEKRHPNFTLATVQPTMCVGPLIQPYLNASNELLLRYLDGSKQKIPRSCVSFVDVRDCAEAHVLIYEKASTGRHLIVGGILTFDHVCSILRRACPGGKVPQDIAEGKQEPLTKYNTSKIKGLGFQPRSLVDTLVDTIDTLRNSGYVDATGRQQQPQTPPQQTAASKRGTGRAGADASETSKAVAARSSSQAGSPTSRPGYMSHDVSDVKVTEDELRDLFNTFDMDNNGYISKVEFKRFYYSMDTMGLPEEEGRVDQMLSKYQYVGDDGRLSFDEFCIVMLKLAQR